MLSLTFYASERLAFMDPWMSSLLFFINFSVELVIYYYETTLDFDKCRDMYEFPFYSQLSCWEIGCFLWFLDIVQIFRALSYIHRCIGVCHRDIKPQNLLVRPLFSYCLYFLGGHCPGFHFSCWIFMVMPGAAKR